MKKQTLLLLIFLLSEMTILCAQAPAGLTGSGFRTTVHLKWNDYTAFVPVGYNIYRSTVSGNYGAPVRKIGVYDNYTDYSLAPGTSYFYKISAFDAAGNESPLSAEIPVSTNNNNYLKVANLDLLIPIYTGGMAPGEPDQIRHDLNIARQFFFRNTKGRLNLNFHFMEIPGYPPPNNDGVADFGTIGADLQNRGIPDNQYDAIHVEAYQLYGWYGGAMWLGQTAGSMAHQPTWTYNPNNYFTTGDAWVFTHEFGHSLDGIIAGGSGFPDMIFNHFPWAFPLPSGIEKFDAGPDFDGMALVLRLFDKYLEFTAPYDGYFEVADADTDGLADNDSRLPADEARFGSSSFTNDSDLDNLTDLKEFYAGIYSGSSPNVKDTDGDGVQDDTDPYPLSNFRPTLMKTTAAVNINGTMAAGEGWQPLVSNPYFSLTPGATMNASATWDDTYLYFAFQSNTPLKYYLYMDGSGEDGLFAAPIRFPGGVYTDMNDKAFGDSYYENAVLIIRSDASQVVLKDQPVAGSQISTVNAAGVYTTEVRLPHNLGPGFGFTYTPPSAPTVTAQSYINGDILGINLIGLPLTEADGNVVDEWRVKNFVSLTEPFHFYDVTLSGGATPPANYCASTSNFPWEDWIAKVKVGTIDNASGKSPYSDFTNLSTNLSTGSTPIELTTGFSYFTWDEYWRVWIDLNHDGDFEDAGEKVFEGIKTKPANGTPTATLSGNLNIPATAMTGSTRMRVTMKRGAYATPCETIPFGEIEDYTVNIQGGPVQLANLVITGYEVIPANANCFANPGESFGYFAGLVLNSGTAAAGPFNLKGWISNDQQISANDVLWQSFSYTGVAPNNVVSWGFTNPVPASLAPGKYFVILQADPDNTVAESNETDNLLTVQIQLGAPDFTVANVGGVPASTAPGSNLIVSVQAKNLAAFPLAEASGNLSAGIFLSADNQLNVNQDLNLITTLIPFSQFSNPPLYLNGTASVNETVTIPGNTAPGNYFILVQLTGVGCEQSSNNNLYNAIPIQITSGGGPVAYCQSYSSFPWEDWIAKVELGNLSNASGKSIYSNFTNLTANLSAGQNYTIKLTTGFSYFTWDEYWRVWIDFNKDGVFSTPDEVVQQRILTAPAAGTATAYVTGNVSIPGWAPVGSTRMRVSMKRGAFPSACEILPFGEVEDYTVNIGGGGGVCTISAVTSNIQCQDNGTPQYPLDDGFTFQVTVTGTNTGSQWQMTWNGGSTTGTYGTPKTVGPLSIATFQNGFNFTVADVGTPTCSTTGSVMPPPPCSTPPQVCGFSKTYTEGNNFNGIFAEQTANGFKVVGAKPLVPTGTTFLILNTNQDGVSTGSTTENVSAPMSFAPFRLKDGNYLFLSVTGDQKVKLEKRNATGAVAWSTTYTIANAEVTNPVNIVEGSDGSIYVTGTVDDSPAGAFFKLFTLKTNSAGVQQWLTKHNMQASQGNFNVKGLAATQDGGLVVYVTPSNVDNHIVRIAANGSLAWNTIVSASPLSPIKNAIEATDGSLLVSYLTDAPTGPTPVNVNFAKLTSAGAVEWSKNQTSIFGNIPNPVFVDFAQPYVAAVPGGNYAVAFTGVGGLYLAGLNSNGATLWTKIHAFMPGIGFFARATDGGYLLAGSMNNQLWLMKTDNVGAICDTPPPPGDYCDSQSDAPWHDWIARVKLNTLDNQSAKSVYSEFTNLSTTLQKGQSYPITLTTGFSWETFNEYWRVWIDWNQDGVFSSPDELVQQQILTAPANGTQTASISGSVNVPQGALTGTTRMRVSMKRGAYATACEHFTNGEVEDYTIVVVSGLTGEGGDRASNFTFEAVGRMTSVELFGAYHEPGGVAEVVFEKSTDGEHYQPLDAMPGGFTEAVDAVDDTPADGPNFYRMLLYLANGEVIVSPVRVISFEPVPDFTVFPNPASTVAHLNLEKYLGNPVHIKLLNSQGILIENIVLDEVGTPVLDIPIEVPSGYYFLWIQMPGRRALSKTIAIERGF